MWYAIILGGGSGTRMGARCNKVLLPLHGIPILIRSVMAFRRLCRGMVVVIRHEDAPQARQLLDAYGFSDVILTDGGLTRQDSVFEGLRALPADCGHVMIHDGARCLVDEATIRRCMEGVERYGSAVASVPVVDTVKSVLPDGKVEKTLDRSRLRAVQTPQGFLKADLLAAHAYAREHGLNGTDDASLLEFMGKPVYLTDGDARNLKITRPEDIPMAEQFLSDASPLPRLRVGSGYDVHRLTEGRELILCGVTIPHTHGLLGHSDADVAVHALMDAMLGACALGDIGHLFPDTDEQYRGISSMLLLKKVRETLDSLPARMVNLDLTICAQKPRLAPYIERMRANLAQCLSMPMDCVSVKATTTEHLGFEGRMEGISATASVLVERLG